MSAEALAPKTRIVAAESLDQSAAGSHGKQRTITLLKPRSSLELIRQLIKRTRSRARMTGEFSEESLECFASRSLSRLKIWKRVWKVSIPDWRRCSRFKSHPCPQRFSSRVLDLFVIGSQGHETDVSTNRHDSATCHAAHRYSPAGQTFSTFSG